MKLIFGIYRGVLGTILITSLALGQSTSISSSRDGERIRYRNNYGVTNFDVETRGRIEISEDDKDVVGMSADGYLEITKYVFGSRRTVVIEPQGNGLKRQYYVGRSEEPFEPEGRKWLAEVLPELVRITTIGAESRVNRFFKKGGAKGVMDEIRNYDSDYVKVHYAKRLMGLNVPTRDYAYVISEMAHGMDSDHYLTEFLKDGLSKFMTDKEATEAVFAATGSMDSDHYRTEVIKEALRSGPATLESVKIIMQATNKMSSDHYRTEVLSTLLKQNNLTDAVVAEMINATKAMNSDHYRTVILTKALNKPGLSSVSFQRVLESIKDMDSDHYKTEVLTSLLQNNLAPELQLTLVTLTGSIDSDHYITVVGKEILKKQNLNDEVFQKLLEAMVTNKSDYYAANFLQAAMERPNLTKQNMTSILQAAGNIDSDHYITEVLTDIAPSIKASNDSGLKDTYRSIARKIDSETYYGRAMKAIDY